MQKILITGSNGMVGRNMVEFEKSKDYVLLTPSSRDLNLLNRRLVDNYIKETKPDIVIHCAGRVGGIQANLANPVSFLVENTQIGLNIIMGSYENGIKKFINMSSSCMYPKDAINPLKEELILKGELEPTNEGYAIAKTTSTRLCEYINRENKEFQYKTIIPCNLYGRYDKFDSKHSHMLPAVIKKIHEAKVNNQNIVEIWGNGEARREFMYVEDLADFTYFALENYEKMPQNINVGLGHDYTINEYYKTIAEVIGYKGKFTHDLLKPVGMRQKLIDDTKLKKFGWKYKTSLKDGIQKTYEYYLKGFVSE
ncbi:GDP-L-fucose synthase family protein [Campylobacter hyointestinalis]|uniref:GDP-L-fucose synthase family protein n=1 Tax=Campylobacter hyointestinalis TaxID=198 RepID=UPI000DCD0009|nr:GDP-L-fucose synthase [Campylobacter hyointestinalis]RAZ60438.1 GDP-L-fucose synthase [Campylobacter hyointestinalis subsp. lawsonii]